jgi:hypothetical protein
VRGLPAGSDSQPPPPPKCSYPDPLPGWLYRAAFSRFLRSRHCSHLPRKGLIAGFCCNGESGPVGVSIAGVPLKKCIKGTPPLLLESRCVMFSAAPMGKPTSEATVAGPRGTGGRRGAGRKPFPARHGCPLTCRS